MSRSARTRLIIVLGLNLTLVAGLVAVGFSAGSLSVLAAGADYLADAAAVAVALFAIWLSRRPPSRRRPEGYPEASAVAAMLNGGWLLLLCILVSAGAIARLATGIREVRGLPVLIVSAIATVAMMAGAFVLRGAVDDLGETDEHAGLSVRAVLLDTVADAGAAAGVAVTGAIILATGGLFWLDPAVALVISGVIAYHAIQLLRQVRVALGASADRA